MFLPCDEEHCWSLIAEKRKNSGVLDALEVDFHVLPSLATFHRNSVTRRMFDKFTNILCRKRSHYRHEGGTPKTRIGSKMGVLTTRSTRLPLGQTSTLPRGGAHWRQWHRYSSGNHDLGTSPQDSHTSDEEDSSRWYAAACACRDINRRTATAGDAGMDGRRSKRKWGSEADSPPTAIYTRHHRDGSGFSRGRGRDETSRGGSMENLARRRCRHIEDLHPAQGSAKEESYQMSTSNRARPISEHRTASQSLVEMVPTADAFEEETTKYVMRAKTFFAHAPGEACHYM